jgi:CYTH domain-containing protein
MSDDADIRNPYAPPGKERKYARRELERRFLLAGTPDGEVGRATAITDRYLLGTRLRLRKMVEVEDGREQAVYKLTQKVPAPDGGPGLVTTFYLRADEHECLAAVPAQVLEKTRLRMDPARSKRADPSEIAAPLQIDVFSPPRVGLFLAEIEFEAEGAMRDFTPPPWCIAEVTHDPRFAGGRLASTTAGELSALLGAFGLPARPFERS